MRTKISIVILINLIIIHYEYPLDQVYLMVQLCGGLHRCGHLYVLHRCHHIENKGLLSSATSVPSEAGVEFLLKEITVSGPDGTQEKIEVPVWNGTAANIILMSLGPRFVI